MPKQLKSILIILFCLSFQNTKANATSDWLKNLKEKLSLANTYSAHYFSNQYPTINQSLIQESLEVVERGEYFEIKAQVLDNLCYTTNANTKTVKYTVTNITANPISFSGAAGLDNFKLQIKSTNINLDDIISITAGYEINKPWLTNLYFFNANTIDAGKSIEFILRFTSSSADYRMGNIEITYGTSGLNSNIDDNSVTEELSITNYVSKDVSFSPEQLTRQLHPQTTYSIQTALGFTNSQSAYVKYYLNNEEISKDYILNHSQLAGFSYAINTCRLSEKANITFSLFGGNLPTPGRIGPANTIVCYDGNVTINNLELGQGTSLYLLRYTWELSYDGGFTWKAPPNNGSTDSNGRNAITINNIKTNLMVRRKAHERPTNLREFNYSYTAPVSITVQENTLSFPQDKQYFAIPKGSTFTFPTVTTSLNSTIEIKNNAGQNVAATQTYTEAGEYNYTVVATTTATNGQLAGCVTTTNLRVIVYDTSSCLTRTNKIFATHQQGWTSGLSGVSTPERAVNNNRANYATLTGGVVLLGIGTVGIDLYFTKPDGSLYKGDELKGKKVTLKLGEQYSGVKVAGGLSVIGRNIENLSDISGIVPPVANAGTTFGVQGSVLEALKGDNVFEFSFTPATASGANVDYNGIRVQLGSLIGVADLATVFHAYIEEEVSIDPNNTSHCYDPENPNQQIIVSPPGSLNYPDQQDGLALGDDDYTNIENNNIVLNPFIDDVTWGNRTEVIDVVTGLNSVIYPYYTVDDNYDSYALFNATVGVLNQQFLRAHLRQTAMPGDQVQITLAYPNINAVNLSLLQLGNFKIVYFLNGVEVGEELMEKFRVLDIGIFNFKDKRRAVISKPVAVPFNSFEIRQFHSVDVNLGQSLRIHDVRINPMMMFEGQEDPISVTKLCAADFLILQSNDYCATYKVSFAKIITFGEGYVDANNNPILDENGQQILMIEEFEDIPDSTLEFSHFSENLAHFNFRQLYINQENQGILLVKIQTYKQGCAYGDPQYLRVKLTNCLDGVVNPTINTASF